ncbi:MAG: trypsin-like peptidase domain-containing protein [Eubacteriales bacterium]
MKQRFGYRAAMFCLSLLLCVSLSGLSGCVMEFDATTTTSDVGVLSPYQLAVQSGFEGSEEEWYAALRGASAYDIWLGLGNTGSEQDFIDSLSPTIQQYDITIQAEAGQAALGKAILSCVSIYADFDVTYRIGSHTFTEQESAAGSGAIYQLDKASGDAYIITNYHVVYHPDSDTPDGISDEIYIYLYGMEYEPYQIEVEYVGGSMYYDIAVLRVKDSSILAGSDACAVEPADSNGVAAGQTAIAIGNPEAQGISATSGIVCVDSEYITMISPDERAVVTQRVIRVDTPINFGNSGGGLFSAQGQLIGIVNAKMVDAETENIGYAIPANIAVNVAQNIIDHCADGTLNTLQRCMLGVSVEVGGSKAVYDPSSGMARVVERVEVSSVAPGSLAEGKLQAGDVIVSLELRGCTYEVSRTFVVVDAMLNARVGDTVTLHLLRGNTPVEVEIVVDAASVNAY